MTKNNQLTLTVFCEGEDTLVLVETNTEGLQRVVIQPTDDYAAFYREATALVAKYAITGQLAAYVDRDGDMPALPFVPFFRA